MIIYVLFTFHSGYILMFKANEKNTTIYTFTFHFGYILIVWSANPKYNTEYIYIPLWLYSNEILDMDRKSMGWNLHSTLVIF